jgi:predicted regulator of Ras-like GTPase activity (Roadblock/LC7/MglB family)
MPRPPHALASEARRAAENLLAGLDGAGAVVIATIDGFDIAHAGRRMIEPARLAAMVSSFAALGDAAGRETGIGATRCLVVESTEGRLVVRLLQVGDESLVVALLTDKAVLLGLAWNHLASIERELLAA